MLKRVVGAVGVLAMTVALAGCAGAGLGEGMAPAGPVKAPNLNDPIFRGFLSGRVTFAEGFLHNWVLAQTGAGEASNLERDRKFYKGLKVKIDGAKGKKLVPVGEDGAFDFGSIRFGEYQLVVEGKQGPLATCPVSLDSKARLALTVRVVGHDLADLDKDGDTDELLVEKELDYKSEDVQYRRVIPPVGDVRTHLLDGSVEVAGQDGYVKVMHADGQVDYRFDPNGKLVDEELEPEVGRKRGQRRQVKAPKDALAAKVTGSKKAPLIMEVALRPVSGSEAGMGLGDLAVLEVRTDDNGGSAVSEVEVRIASRFGASQTVPLADDGGRQDRKPKIPGLQSSLDRVAGDGVFSFPVPLDAPTFRFLSASQVVATATNERRLTSRPASLHTYWPRGEEAEAEPRLARSVQSVQLVRNAQGVSARMVLRTMPDPVPAVTLAGPGGFRRLAARSGKNALVTTPAPLAPGLYTLVASTPGGDVFYASFPVRGEEPAEEAE